MLKDKIKKIGIVTAFGLNTALSFAMPVYAGSKKLFEKQPDVAVNTEFDPSDALTGIIGGMIYIVQLVGVGATVWGVYSLYQCITQDRPEQRTKAIMEIAGGLMAAGGLQILRMLGVIGGGA